jgi:hypothetical protein
MIGGEIKMREFDSPAVYKPKTDRNDLAKKYDMSFLYSRESERIGTGIANR